MWGSGRKRPCRARDRASAGGCVGRGRDEAGQGIPPGSAKSSRGRLVLSVTAAGRRFRCQLYGDLHGGYDGFEANVSAAEVLVDPFVVEDHVVEVGPDTSAAGAAVGTADAGTVGIDAAASGLGVVMGAVAARQHACCYRSRTRYARGSRPNSSSDRASPC
jgi:hypothetical protein